MTSIFKLRELILLYHLSQSKEDADGVADLIMLKLALDYFLALNLLSSPADSI